MTGDRPTKDPEFADKMPLLELVLQNEGAASWFRNLKVRRIDSSQGMAPAGQQRGSKIDLFNGRDLEGWTWIPQVPSSARDAGRE